MERPALGCRSALQPQRRFRQLHVRRAAPSGSTGPWQVNAANSATAIAFDALEGRQRYPAAIAGFRRFPARVPDQHALADNAQYWLGEAYYVTRDYDRALTAFTRVGQLWPDSRKAPDAALKLGYTQFELKRFAAARSHARGRVQQSLAGFTEAARLAAGSTQEACPPRRERAAGRSCVSGAPEDHRDFPIACRARRTAVGIPTTFVRLTGCPLRCHYCDTAYAFQGGEWWTIDAISSQRVREEGARHVCVTGGEPLAQAALPGSLLAALCDAGFRVSLETSGAIDYTRR